MRRPLAFRSLGLASGLICGAVLAGACGGGDGDVQVDTAAGQVGVADSAPASTATAVAAILSDENVFAVLDTAFSAMIETDRLAQQTTKNTAVNQFAGKGVSEGAVTRSGIRTTAERLSVAPVLPDRDVIEDHQQKLSELRSRTGAEFDRAYLDRAIEMRKELIDEIDDALEGGGVKQEPVRRYLSDVRVSLDASRKVAEDLRSKM